MTREGGRHYAGQVENHIRCKNPGQIHFRYQSMFLYGKEPIQGVSYWLDQVKRWKDGEAQNQQNSHFQFQSMTHQKKSIMAFWRNMICHKTLSLKMPNVEFDLSVSVDKMQLLTHTSKIQSEYLSQRANEYSMLDFQHECSDSGSNIKNLMSKKKFDVQYFQ